MKRSPILVDEMVAKRFAGSLMQKASLGSDVVILRNGTPYAKPTSIRPIDRTKR